MAAQDPDGRPERPLVGFAIPRRVGSAVRRNRVRRRLRAAIAELHERAAIRPGRYLVVVHPGATDRPFADLRADLAVCFDELGARERNRW